MRPLAAVAPAFAGPADLLARLGPYPATGAVRLATDGLVTGTARLLDMPRGPKHSCRPPRRAAKAGVELTRTAHTQFRHGPRLPSGVDLRVGDLVFYGTYAKVHHVGLYIGSGRMVNAPTFGQPVRTAWYRWAGDDYLSATRPSARSMNLPPSFDVPETPDPSIPDVSEFRAPPAPALPVLTLPTASPPTTIPPTTIPPPTYSPPDAGPAVAADPTTTPSAQPEPTDAGSAPASNTPTTSMPTSAPQTLDRVVAIVDAGTLRPLDAVGLGPDRIPVRPGSAVDPESRNWRIRLSAPLADTAPGSTLVVHTDDTRHRLRVVETWKTGTDEILALRDRLVLVVAIDSDRWQVTTAALTQ